MRVFQIGRDIDLVDRHEHAFKVKLARDDRAQLAFQRLRLRGVFDVSSELFQLGLGTRLHGTTG